MDHLIGVAAGLLLGGLVALLKGKLLWQTALKRGPQSTQNGDILLRSMASFLVNAGTLALVFFLRGRCPFDWMACIIATAVALATVNHLYFKGKTTS